VAFHDTLEASKNRSKLFDAEGKVIMGTIETFEDLFGLYDRYFKELGGIAGGLAVEDGVIYYATGAGSVAAVRVGGLPAATGEE
jgi:hypothetical protein